MDKRMVPILLAGCIFLAGCALLAYPLLAAEEVRNCREELKNIRWENAATKLRAIYDQLVAGRR